MRRVPRPRILLFVALTIVAVWVVPFTCLSVSSGVGGIMVDLHEYGFPSASNDGMFRVFYLSKDRLALFFDQQLPGASTQDHAFKLMVLDLDGHITAQLVVHGDPKALDLTAGPGGGVLFGREGQLDFYDSKLQLLKSIPLARGTTGVRFDRQRDQLVVMTIDERLGQRTAHFRDGKTLEESVALSYPIKSQAIFGEDQLVYVVTGNCKGAAHVVSNRSGWRSVDQLPACDPLTFITNDSMAYASSGRLFVVDSNANELLQLRIPAPSTFEMPRFIGLSDDRTRLAISAIQREKTSAEWPYYDDVFVYDLSSKRMVFEHALKKGDNAESLSPDGHQLATIERGILLLTSVP